MSKKHTWDSFFIKLQAITIKTILTKGNKDLHKHTLEEIYESFKQAFFDEKGISKALIDNYRKALITKFQTYSIEGGSNLSEKQEEKLYTLIKENADKFIA